MVKDFRFSGVPTIIFRAGSLEELPAILKKKGSKVMLVTGRNSFVMSEAGVKLLNRFDIEGIRYKRIEVNTEPSPELVDEVVSTYQNESFDVVVAIGGGSAMDAGKAISAMLPLGKPVSDYLEGVGTGIHPGTKIPFVAVPTTSGTGSEATKNAVISRIGKEGFKRSLRHDNFAPDVALVDPLLTLNCPQFITGASGMDCFTQLTEAYLSDKASDYTDALAFEGIRAVKDSLFRCYIDGSDVEARKGMSFAALTSGICIANAGLGTVHGFASSVGALYNIPHGLVCGTLMAETNKVVVRKLRSSSSENQAFKKYVLLGRLFSESEGRTDSYYIDAFVDNLFRLTSDLNLPGLRNYGVSEGDLEKICKNTDNKNNPVKLAFDDLLEILNSRL